MSGPLRIRKKQGCIRNLQYELFLSDDVKLPNLADALLTLGFERASSRGLPAIRLLHQTGHEVLIVPRTRRVQLRVSYVIPKEERPDAAKRIEGGLNGKLGEHRPIDSG
jgi:hypothetical protein